MLRYLRERCFTEDRAYPEKEVNQRLALFHPDVAALRRYLVDDGLMTPGRPASIGVPEASTARVSDGRCARPWPPV